MTILTFKEFVQKTLTEATEACEDDFEIASEVEIEARVCESNGEIHIAYSNDAPLVKFSAGATSAHEDYDGSDEPRDTGAVHNLSLWEDMKIESLGLPTRIVNVLSNKHVTTVGNLTSLGAKDLMSFDGISKYTVGNIIEALSELGLCLKKGLNDD